jgi:hypothetical protein
MRNLLFILFLIPIAVFSQKSFQSKGKYGFKTAEKITIPATYDYASDFLKGLACVKKNDKWGFINTQNEWISNKYDKIQPLRNGHAVVLLDKMVGIIDSTMEEVVPLKYSDVNIERDYFELIQDSLVGMQSSSIDIPCKYKYVYQYKNGFAYGRKYDQQYDIYDKNGLLLENQEIPMGKRDIYKDKNVIAKKNGKYGLFNSHTKEWVIEAKYATIEKIYCDSYEVGNEEYSEIVYALSITSKKKGSLINNIRIIQSHNLKTIVEKVTDLNNIFNYRTSDDCELYIDGAKEPIMLNDLLKELNLIR